MIFYYFFLLLNKGQCVRLFSIEIQTTGLIAMKFGTKMVLKGGKVLGRVLTPYPLPLGYGVHKGGPAF